MDLAEYLTYEERPNVEDEQYSFWIRQGSEYVAAVGLTTEKKMVSGVYRITYSRDEYHFSIVDINTDELYIFTSNPISQIINEINKFWDSKELFDKYKLNHRRGLLLESKAGAGKTSCISLLIKELIKRDGLIFLINNPADFENVSIALKNIVRKVEPTRPIITVIEDVDKLIQSIGGNDAELLNFIDGKMSIDNHLIIFTSNNTASLSQALLRPSRIDMRIVLPLPSKETRREYFELKGIPESQLEEYVERTDKFSMADLKEVFIGTQILQQPLDTIVHKIISPLTTKDYLSKSKQISI